MRFSPLDLVLGTLLAALTSPLLAQEFPQAFSADEEPADHRLGELRNLDSYHPFHPVQSPEQWQRRAALLRRQVLVANGLWPLPHREPLRAHIHGRVERDEYTVEKVSFESFPGHFVTGSLYRPRHVAPDSRIPGILSPHGHWNEGRFHDHGDATLQSELDSGAEKFPSGRYPLQARCVHLARMGCLVFHYDMVGYADSVQLEHRKSSLPEDSAGLFSTAADLRLQSMMGIQTFNSIRALDFLETLPEVDPDRIGVTGASGGGTQTFVLGAVDDRPDLLFPAVMVSTAMQGGCVCENANYLRVGAGNIDLAALAAPRPLGLTGADDWTVDIESKGQPDLESLYRLLEAPAERFQVFPYLQFGHNYNAVSRQAMYRFVRQHFALGESVPVEERDFTPLTKEELSVWNSEHPAPRSRGAAHERALLRWWAADSDTQIAALSARQVDSSSDVRAFEEVVGGGWNAILGRSLAQVGPIEYTLVAKKTLDPQLLGMTGRLRSAHHQEEVPALFLHPSQDWNGEVVLWITSEGKSAALDNGHEPLPALKDLTAAGYAVMAIDVLLTGESLGKRAPLQQAPLVNDAFSAFTYGYNHPLFVKRVHDVLTAVAFAIDNPTWDVKKIHLLAADPRGALLALAARTQCPADGPMGKTVLPLEGARLADAGSTDDLYFVPGAVKYGDVPGLLALCAPAPVMVIEKQATHGWPLASQAYLAADASPALQGRESMSTEEIRDWLAQ